MVIQNQASTSLHEAGTQAALTCWRLVHIVGSRRENVFYYTYYCSYNKHSKQQSAQQHPDEDDPNKQNGFACGCSLRTVWISKSVHERFLHFRTKSGVCTAVYKMDPLQPVGEADPIKISAKNYTGKKNNCTGSFGDDFVFFFVEEGLRCTSVAPSTGLTIFLFTWLRRNYPTYFIAYTLPRVLPGADPSQSHQR